MRQKSSQSVAVENRGVTLGQEVMSSVNLRSLARKFSDSREQLNEDLVRLEAILLNFEGFDF